MMNNARIDSAVFTGALSSVAIGTSANAQDYLTRIDSEVFQTTGSLPEIAGRAWTCIDQILASGVQGGQLNIRDNGATIVANNVSTYSASLVQWRIRSRVVFEARDGRFRIAHANPERFHDLRAVGRSANEGFPAGRRPKMHFRPLRMPSPHAFEAPHQKTGKKSHHDTET